MPGPTPNRTNPPNPFVEMIEALSNRHGQVDIHFDRVALRFPFGGEVELSGALTVSVHLRELSERERKAHQSRQLRSLAG